MELELSAETDFSSEFKSELKAQCTETIALIEADSKSDPHEVVHEVRKAFKRVRGGLRLVRDEIDFYKKENAFFRDEGRKISELRDATSVIEVLDDLYDQYEDQLYKNTFNTFRSFLEDRQAQMASDLIEDKGILKTIGKRLAEKCEEMDGWSIEIESFEDIEPAVMRVSKRGLKGYEKAKKSGSTEDFHEWRKRVKYLRSQLDLLNEIWPEFLECWEDQLHDLSDFLGDDHDLYLLDKLIDEHTDQFSDPESAQLLKSLIQSQRAYLQEDSLLLGKRIYALKPKQFNALLRASWEAFYAESVAT